VKRSEERADARDVRPRCFAQLVEPRVGERRVDDAAVRGAVGALDVVGALEPLEQPRDPGSREDDALRQLDAAQPAVGRAREMEEHLVVVDRQYVLADEVGVQLACEASMAP
jgi:hypothetical protein